MSARYTKTAFPPTPNSKRDLQDLISNPNLIESLAIPKRFLRFTNKPSPLGKSRETNAMQAWKINLKNYEVKDLLKQLQN